MDLKTVSILKAAGDAPMGRRLAMGIMAYFRRQLAQVISWIGQWVKLDITAANPPDLTVWTEQMAEMGGNFLTPPFVRGGNDMARRISLVLPGGTMSPKDIFQSIHPKVGLAVDRLSLDFCQETNATSNERLDLALRNTRQEIREGLELGEALPELTDRVSRIFSSPRAIDIARTESARAMMAGQMMAAKDSGVVEKKMWLAKNDACKKFCWPLNGKVVGLDEPFTMQPKPGPYAVIMYPPYHPNCTCTWQPVISPEYLGKKGWDINKIREMLQNRLR